MGVKINRKTDGSNGRQCAGQHKKSFTTTLNQTWNINHLAISSFNNKQTSNDMNVATPKSQWAQMKVHLTLTIRFQWA